MADKLWLLSRINLLEGLGPAEILRMSHLFHMTTHAPRTHLDGASSDRILLLKQGKVRLYRITRDGREATTALVTAGQLFGFGALFGRETNATRIEVVEESIVCEIAPSQFVSLIASSPTLMSRVMMTMARQILTLERRVEELALQPVQARLARLLLEVSHPDGQQDPPVCDWSQEELANALACTRESVARSLGQWRREGIVGISRRRVVIKRKETLDRISEAARPG